MPLTVKTNNHWRFTTYGADVPASVMADQFEHLGEDERVDGFICYRGHWYHVSDFMRIEHNADLAGWHGYTSDSAFSGVLIRLSDDGETVMMGTYYS